VNSVSLEEATTIADQMTVRESKLGWR
jgi:hypothetical protein